MEVLLGPGEALWLPYGWWHQVQSLDRDTTSLNLFLEDPGVTSPGLVMAPLMPGSLLALAREAEALLAEQLGPPGPPALARWCAELAGVEGRADAGAAGSAELTAGVAGMDQGQLRRLRAYLVQRLLQGLRPSQAAEVLALALDWRRFARLVSPPSGSEKLFAQVRRLGHAEEAMWEYDVA